MKKTRLFALVLCLSLLLGLLAGCSKGKDSSSSGGTLGKPDAAPEAEPAEVIKTSDAAAQTSAKYVYTAEYMDLRAECEYINQTCVSGDYLYFSGDVMTDPGSGDGGFAVFEDEAAAREVPETKEIATEEPAVEEYVPATYETRLYRMDLRTGEIRALDFYAPLTADEGFQGNGYISALLAGSDGSVWIFDSFDNYRFELPDDFDPMSQSQWDFQVQGPSHRRLQKFSAEGEVLQSLSIEPETLGLDAYIDINFIDAKDHIYCYDWQQGILILDTQGKIVKTIDVGDEGGQIMPMGDKAALMTWGEKQTYQFIDPDTLEMEGEPFVPPYGAWSFMASNDEAYDYYYQTNGNVFGYKMAENVSDKVVDWIDVDVNVNDVQSVYTDANGRILALLSSYDEQTFRSTYSLVILTKTDAANVKPKTVLTLACLELDWDLRNQIIAFNKSSQDYRIVINEYIQYSSQEDWRGGLTKLNTEILSGKVPDLLWTGELPIAKYAAKGLLEDLLPYIDKDAELSRDDLMMNVIDAACLEGKLYEAFSGFYIESALALDKVVGEYDQWTLAELKDAMTKLQPQATVFSDGYTKEDVLNSCVSRVFNTFVNWETGECNFDSQEFKDILEFANSFPAEYNWEDYDHGEWIPETDKLKNGLQLLSSFSLFSVRDSLYTYVSFQDTDIRFVGFPSTLGNNSTFNRGGGLAITSTCADKEGAWSFVRQLFTEDFQEDIYMLPTNAKVFNRRLQDAMTIEYETDENGNFLLDENGDKVVIPKTTFWNEDDTTVSIDCMSQEQADQLMELYNNTHTFYVYDTEIYDVVKNECQGYFAGQTPLDEIVKRIQNRVSLYVAEQK